MDTIRAPRLIKMVLLSSVGKSIKQSVKVTAIFYILYRPVFQYVAFFLKKS